MSNYGSIILTAPIVKTRFSGLPLSVSSNVLVFGNMITSDSEYRLWYYQGGLLNREVFKGSTLHYAKPNPNKARLDISTNLVC